MCGIAGIVRFEPDAPALEREVRAMNMVCAPRGPDGEGLWVRGPVAFGHRRLAVIDLSDRANQPMVDAAGRIAVTFNGEIYNFRDLRRELELQGVQFRSDSDTEVILQGYQFWGIDQLLDKLDGMFAFALYDIRERRTYLCRDRFGKKPLYYCLTPDRIAFCSDIRGLWLIEPHLTVDGSALDHYLTELSVPQPLTIWREIRQVNAASVAAIDAAGVMTERVYWTRTCEPRIGAAEPEVLEELASILQKAVVKRTVSDVPLGAFLSSGTDSGLIVALLAASWGARLRTLSVSVPDRQIDEAPLARAIAERCGTTHTQLNIESGSADVLPNIVEAFGEPFADSSALPMYLMSREIRRHVTVVLSGDGGDELFGYPDYVWVHRADEHFGRYTNRASRLVARAIDKARRLAGQRGEFVGFIQHIGSKTGAEQLYRTMGFSFSDKAKLYRRSWAEASSNFAQSYLQTAWDRSARDSIADTLIEAGIRTRLLNDYLVKVDRASMSQSLEVRSPFLDRQLAEFAIRIPNTLRFRNGVAKYLLKKLAAPYLGSDILERPKRGFAIPVSDWLRGDFGSFAADLFASMSFRTRGIFDNQFVSRLLSAHQAGREDHAHRLWCLICLELWFRRFVDRPQPCVEPGQFSSSLQVA
jgi:asparagine synthase (glutamine-hydrolysing)